MRTGRTPLLVVAVLLAAMAPGCSPTPSIDGHWLGVLNPGTDSLRKFDVDISRFKERWIAEVDDDRGMTDYPVGIEVLSQSDVILKLRPGIVFRGRLASDGKTLAGAIASGESRTPLAFSRKGPAKISRVRIDFESLPAGSNRLTVLSPNSDQLKNAFNRDRSKVRLVALLSPT